MSNGATETTIASIANKFAYGGGGVAVVGGLGANELAAFGGLLIGILGFFVTVYYRRKADARDAAAEQRAVDEHVARMALLARGIDPHGE